MLSDREKKEMLEDGLSKRRREKFTAGEESKPKIPWDLNDYIAFLNALQKIRSFRHERVITPCARNIL